MQAKYDIDSLRHIAILDDLPPWQLEVVAEAMESLETRNGKLILEHGSDDGYTYFFTQGQLELEAPDGGTKLIEANEDNTSMPFANLRPRMFNVRAKGNVSAMRVPDIVLSAAGCSGRAHDPKEIVVQSEEDLARSEAESKLSFRLYRDLQTDKAILPSLPDLALRIRRAIDDDISDAKAVAKLVESDPAMATKLLKVANSALYGGLNAVETCSNAVVRLGMDTTKKLVLTFALKEVFRSKEPVIQKRMQALWRHSAYIAAICFVLARRVPGMHSEEALLIGLVHDVGSIAILNYIEKYPELAENEAMLEETISRLRGELGAMILRKWNFGPQVVAGARDAENWTLKHNRDTEFTDLLIVAQVHDRLRLGQTEGLPTLDKIHAIQRVLGDQASPETSLEILHEAKAQIEEMSRVLQG